ncbi:High mobility group superfamily [Penicillium paradoxum]|uniref:High mobility group superfamily n=1 Tax=Penicillium paradoxum TaxID=176176 RepID=UPI0025475DB6|nr:High mobility group superfamily [Penicillium paradoxum]KAJ5779437.1 High mobility group superfamily [Penicillium paradoxum]
MTLVTRSIPASPPHTPDGHPLPEESFEDPGIYQPVYSKMSPQEIHSGNQPQAMARESLCCNAIMCETDLDMRNQMMAASSSSSQVTTPPSTCDEALISMGSPSMLSSSPSQSRSPQRNGKAATAVKRRQSRNRRILSDSGFKLDGPISQLTESFHTTPIKDMDAWVARSTVERRDEVRKKNGKISRPMNSFMLYRSAYAERTKRLVGANNHQIVSKIAGQGWKLEPADIRRKYEDLAKIERDNHARTHPDYKFSPNKNTGSSRRDSSSPSVLPAHLPEEGNFSDMESDYGSNISGIGPMQSFAHSRSQSFEETFYGSSRDSSPFGGPDSMTPGYIHSSWQNTSHPSGVPGVQPSSLQNSYTEDVSFRPVSPTHQDMGYGSSLAGLPGAAHHELLQPQLGHTSHGMPMHDMDPRLLSNSGESTGVAAMTGSSYSSTPGSYSTWGDETHGGYFAVSSGPPMSSNTIAYPHSNMTSAYLPSMQNLEIRDQWDMSRPENNIAEATPSEFDAWCTPDTINNNY